MPPLNLTGDVIFPLTRHLNNSFVAHNATINARGPVVRDYSQPKIGYPKIAAIIVGGFILGIILVFLFCRTFEKVTERPESQMPPGHVYGHDSASSDVLSTLRPDRSYERPTFEHVENSVLFEHQWGGSAVSRPAPAATHGWHREDESPPPPCK